ncbi:hypothetical protein NPIL_63841 [Nephila pilipes]|uniref:Uncharacterized protein n=1 Tax=Nephila pilipes TaxID=299642 RepID=A0A8X6JRK0_NEPPI|nr:hypothetical protein NPIL_63841 [Nephila pilipes]
MGTGEKTFIFFVCNYFENPEAIFNIITMATKCQQNKAMRRKTVYLGDETLRKCTEALKYENDLLVKKSIAARTETDFITSGFYRLEMKSFLFLFLPRYEPQVDCFSFFCLMPFNPWRSVLLV